MDTFNTLTQKMVNEFRKAFTELDEAKYRKTRITGSVMSSLGNGLAEGADMAPSKGKTDVIKSLGNIITGAGNVINGAANVLEERSLNQEREGNWKELKVAYRQNRKIPSRAYLNELLGPYATKSPAEQVCAVYELFIQNSLPINVNLVDALVGIDAEFRHIKQSLSLHEKTDRPSGNMFLDFAAELEKSMN